MCNFKQCQWTDISPLSYPHPPTHTLDKLPVQENWKLSWFIKALNKGGWLHFRDLNVHLDVEWVTPI